MHLYLSIAFTLLAAVAGMYLLAKTKTENLGRFFTVVSYLVIVVALLSMLCQVTRGVCRMACHTGICTPSENCMPEMMHHKKMMHGMGAGCMMGPGCADEEGCCRAGDRFEKAGRGGHGYYYKSGEGKHGCMDDEDEDDGSGMKKDSVR